MTQGRSAASAWVRHLFGHRCPEAADSLPRCSSGPEEAPDAGRQPAATEARDGHNDEHVLRRVGDALHRLAAHEGRASLRVGEVCVNDLLEAEAGEEAEEEEETRGEGGDRESVDFAAMSPIGKPFLNIEHKLHASIVIDYWWLGKRILHAKLCRTPPYVSTSPR